MKTWAQNDGAKLNDSETSSLSFKWGSFEEKHWHKHISVQIHRQRRGNIKGCYLAAFGRKLWYINEDIQDIQDICINMSKFRIRPYVLLCHITFTDCNCQSHIHTHPCHHKSFFFLNQYMTKKQKTKTAAISYLGLKPLSASRQKGKTENKICSLVNG